MMRASMNISIKSVSEEVCKKHMLLSMTVVLEILVLAKAFS